MSRLLRAVVLAGCLAALPAAAVTVAAVDLDARVHVRGGNLDNPVFVLLDAGEYTVTPVAGTFTAWNAWFPGGGTSGCSGTACARGWVNNWSIFTPDSPTLPFQRFGQGTGVPGKAAFSTADLALSSAVSFMFTLLAPERVGFVIADVPVKDNAGGLSLRVDRTDPPAAVPLPPALALMLGGLGALWAARRLGRRAA
jgi:hypothetical protein